MKDVLFVQGAGEGAYAADAALAESLQSALGAAYRVRYPKMPNEESPDYVSWKSTLVQEISAIGDGATLVAHSAGATILITSLAESGSSVEITGLFLIAPPFIGEGGWSIPDSETTEGVGAKLPQALPIYLYHGRDDDVVPVAHAELYANAIPQAHVRRLDHRDHQLNDDLAEVAADIRTLE